MNSWKLFGIHDVMVLVKGKDSNKNLSKLIEYTRKIASGKFDKPPRSKIRMLNEVSPEIYRNKPLLDLFSETVHIIEFWCDLLIPLKINSQELLETDKPLLITFLRLNLKSKDNYYQKISGINDYLSRNEELYQKIIGFFQGYGLYDLIFIIKCENYKDANNNLRILRNMNIDESLHLKSPLILDSASIITVSEKSNEELRFSALLKIKPGADQYIKWSKVKDIIEKKIRENCVENDENVIISVRQGFFDYIITFNGKLNDYLKFMGDLTRLPYIEDVATILRYDVPED